MFEPFSSSEYKLIARCDLFIKSASDFSTNESSFVLPEINSQKNETYDVYNSIKPFRLYKSNKPPHMPLWYQTKHNKPETQLPFPIRMLNPTAFNAIRIIISSMASQSYCINLVFDFSYLINFQFRITITRTNNCRYDKFTYYLAQSYILLPFVCYWVHKSYNRARIYMKTEVTMHPI